jgi:histidinol phosphatase-like enzyme
LARYGVTVDGIYYCPHHPDEGCACRKPGTGLFENAIRDHEIDVSLSYMLGDKILDIEAGRNVGVTTILIPEPQLRDDCLARKHTWTCNPDFIADDFADAVKWILKVRQT